jgi:uncharacterized membrane protein
MKEAMTIIMPICFIFILPLTIVFSLWLDKLLAKNKRKKHPLYFEAYDTAMKISFDASAKVKHVSSYIEFQFKMLTEGLAEGECTEEYFKKRFEYLANLYVDTTKWFKEQQKEAEKFFREADLYAKENNLLWGIVY